jgi:FtsZ-interacting cell division protein YlmF
MRMLRLGTLLTVVPLLAAALAIYRDREYVPQLACSIVGLVSEIDYCRELIASRDEETVARRKRAAANEAEAAEQRRRDAEKRLAAAEAARRQAEEEAYAERRRKREAEKEAEEAELLRWKAEQKAKAAELARRQAEAEAAAIQPAAPREYSPPQQSASSYWMHNNSLVMMSRSGTGIRFVYENPRQGMRDEGVTQGTLLFEGRASGNTYNGTAYVFSGRCGTSFPYPVTGNMTPDGTQLRLIGQAPSRIGPDCSVVGYRNDNLLFNRVN